MPRLFCGECDGTGECPQCVEGEEEFCDACAGSEDCVDCDGTGEIPDEDLT